MKKIIILDFNRGEVFVYSLNKEYYNEPEKFIVKKTEHKTFNCEWMVVDEFKINFNNLLLGEKLNQKLNQLINSIIK